MRLDRMFPLLTTIILGVSGQVPAAAAQAVAPARAVTLVESRRYTGEFGYIGGIVLSGDGATALVSQPSERQFALLSSTAAQVSMIGRRGEGPGEFRSISGYGSTGQAFWVYDRALMRLSMFDLSGRLLLTRPWQPKIDGVGPVRAPALLGLDGAKTFVTTGMRPRGLGVGGGIGDRLFLVTSDSGKTWRTVAQAKGPEACAVSTPEVSVPVPNCPMPTYEASTDGNALVIVQPSPEDPFVIGVTMVRPTGHPGYSRRLTFREQPIPRVVQDSVRRYLESRKLPAKLPPLPRFYPMVGRVLLDGDSNAYLEELVAGRPDSWLVLDSTGRAVERLRLPEGARLLAVSGREYWAAVTTEDGEPAVLLLRR